MRKDRGFVFFGATVFNERYQYEFRSRLKYYEFDCFLQSGYLISSLKIWHKFRKYIDLLLICYSSNIWILLHGITSKTNTLIIMDHTRNS